jgi:hypothetical protein
MKDNGTHFVAFALPWLAKLGNLVARDEDLVLVVDEVCTRGRPRHLVSRWHTDRACTLPINMDDCLQIHPTRIKSTKW